MPLVTELTLFFLIKTTGLLIKILALYVDAQTVWKYAADWVVSNPCNEVIKHRGIIDVLSESHNTALCSSFFLFASCSWFLMTFLFQSVSVFISNSANPCNSSDVLQFRSLKFKFPYSTCHLHFYSFNAPPPPLRKSKQDMVWWGWQNFWWWFSKCVLRSGHWCQSVDHHFRRERRLGDTVAERLDQVQQVWAQAGGRISLLRHPQPGRALQSTSLARQHRSATRRKQSLCTEG